MMNREEKAVYMRAYRKSEHGKAIVLKNKRDARKRDRLKLNEKQKQRGRENPTLGRANSLKRNFGLTIASYEELLSLQNFRCAICEKKMLGQKRRFAVDHCHETLKIRGILCTRCNVSIGAFEDKPELLDAAASYLRKNK